MQANSAGHDRDPSSEEGSQYFSFFLGGEVYGIDILRVQEIRGWEPTRSLPDTPAHVIGVLDLRGIIVPVIDLRVRFGLPDPEYSATTVVIVMNIREDHGKTRIIGAVVDAVSDVLDIAGRDIKAVPSIGSCIGSFYLNGMVTVGERMVILLDIDKLFDERELDLIELQ